jgi:quercetin dioxygenase-like cupin family protein
VIARRGLDGPARTRAAEVTTLSHWVDQNVAMGQRESYKIVHRDELERAGKWSLVRRTLECEAFGANLVEIAAGESIPEHDERGRDQEELFFVLTGSPVLSIDGKEHPAPAGTFARLDPEHRRTVINPGPQTASVLIVSAPRASGYEPMEWA